MLVGSSIKKSVSWLFYCYIEMKTVISMSSSSESDIDVEAAVADEKANSIKYFREFKKPGEQNTERRQKFGIVEQTTGLSSAIRAFENFDLMSEATLYAQG